MSKLRICFWKKSDFWSFKNRIELKLYNFSKYNIKAFGSTFWDLYSLPAIINSENDFVFKSWNDLYPFKTGNLYCLCVMNKKGTCHAFVFFVVKCAGHVKFHPKDEEKAHTTKLCYLFPKPFSLFLVQYLCIRNLASYAIRNLCFLFYYNY